MSELSEQLQLILKALLQPFMPLFEWLVKHNLYEAVFTSLCVISIGSITVATILHGLDAWGWLVMSVLSVLAGLAVYWTRKAGRA